MRIVMRVWDAVSRRILELERKTQRGGGSGARSVSALVSNGCGTGASTGIGIGSFEWNIRTEADRQAFLAELESRLRSEGALAVWTEVVATSASA